MRLFTRVLLLFMIALLLGTSLSSPRPAQAAQGEKKPEPVPGHYQGFARIILHSDSTQPRDFPGGAKATVDYEGLWMVKDAEISLDIAGPGNMKGSINLSTVNVAMDYTDSFQSPVGNCLWGAYLKSLGRFSSPPGSHAISGSSFHIPLTFKDNRLLAFELTKASGSLKGCDKRVAPAIWKSLKTASDFGSKVIQGIDLYVDKLLPAGEPFGHCTVPGWDTSEAPANGSYVRDTVECSWLAFLSTEKPKKGWQ